MTGNTNPFRIGSFNLFKFSKNRSDQEIRKNLPMIADMIGNENIDILAVQEIFSKSAMEELRGYLHGNWDGEWASPDSHSVSAAEGYAFLWNTNTIKPSENRSGKVFRPVIFKQYKIDKSIGQTHLIRDPFYGRFTLKNNTQIEIRLINTHIMFSKSRSENETDDRDDSPSLGDIAMRRNEFRILSQVLFPEISDKAYDYQYGQGDVNAAIPYTILLGDYNLNLYGSNASSPYIDILDANYTHRDGNRTKQIKTVQTDLTTLRAKSRTNPEEPITQLKNNYDHFTYDTQRPMEAHWWTVDPLARGYYTDKYDDYKKEVSDHLMIVMEIAL